jgi:AraC-like DNA-binding protein
VSYCANVSWCHALNTDIQTIAHRKILENMRIKPLYVHASLVYPFVEYVTGAGGLTKRDLERTGLPAIDYSKADSSVSEATLCNFVNQYASNCPGMEFGLESAVATGNKPAGFDVMPKNEISAFSVLKRICDEKNRLSPYPYYWLQRDGEITWICRGPHIAPFDIREIELFAVYRLIEVVRMLTGSEFVPSEVALKTPEIGMIRNYPLLATALLRLNASQTRIAIPHTLLMEPARMVADDEFLEAARAHLEEVVKDEKLPGINDLAESMGFSRRNLQRFLRARNTSFRMLHDEHVFRTARRLWGNGEESITEVAMELGYSNHSNFNRAIARIVGDTPTAFRNQVQSQSKGFCLSIDDSDQEPQLEPTGRKSKKESRQSNLTRNFTPKDPNLPQSTQAGFSFKNTWQLNYCA